MKNQFARIIYKYYCESCSKIYKMELDFDDRLKNWGCPKCLKKLKYKGGTDARVSSTGNCGYVSCEKQSEENWKKLSSEEKEIHLANSLTVQRDKRNQEANKGRFWKNYCPDPNKPLDLSKIKDVEKFILTGDTQ